MTTPAKGAEMYTQDHRDDALFQAIADVLTWDDPQEPKLVIRVDASTDSADEFHGQAALAISGNGNCVQAGLTPEKVDELIEALQAVKAFYADNADEDDEPGCEGHPAGEFDPMGETVYCDGSCSPKR